MMQEFPFTAEEWDELKGPALAAVNARLAEDDVLRASAFVDLQEALAALRARHGEHPALLETEADFTEEPGEQVELYRRARDLAVAHRLPSLSIRLALARVLLDDLGRPAEARAELLACEDEVRKHDDESERQDWQMTLDRATDLLR